MKLDLDAARRGVVLIVPAEPEPAAGEAVTVAAP
jgi:hypothetical protein